MEKEALISKRKESNSRLRAHDLYKEMDQWSSGLQKERKAKGIF